MNSTRLKATIIIIMAIALTSGAALLLFTLQSSRAIPLTPVTFENEDMTVVTDYEPAMNLMIISQDYSLPEDANIQISEYRSSGVAMASIMTEDYGIMSDYIRANFETPLYVESSYRSFEDQQHIFEEEGPDVAAVPGCSEHQTGLALDVYVMYHAGRDFINTDVGRYVNEHCGEYGFIIRYPAGKKTITGFAHEPWHIRYVGFPHSEIISECGLALEEYIDSMEKDTWYRYENYLICRQTDGAVEIPSCYASNQYVISPDNRGSTIVTIRIE